MWSAAAMNWTFCWLPFESSSARRPAISPIRNRVEPGPRLAPGGRRRQAVEGGEVDELVEDRHARIQAAFLGQVAPRPARDGRDGLAVPAHLAAIRVQDPQADAHGGRLARAVRPEEAEDGPARDVERQLVQGERRREPLGDVIDLESHGRDYSPGPPASSPERRSGRQISMPRRTTRRCRQRACAACHEWPHGPPPPGSMRTAARVASRSSGTTVNETAFATRRRSAGSARARSVGARRGCPAGSTAAPRSPPTRPA